MLIKKLLMLDILDKLVTYLQSYWEFSTTDNTIPIDIEYNGTDDKFKHAEVEVVIVDKDSLNSYRYVLPLIYPKKTDILDALSGLLKSIPVGAFIILENGEVYRRIKGGFRKANDNDMVELLTIQIGGSNEI